MDRTSLRQLAERDFTADYVMTGRGGPRNIRGHGR
jgi:hypothetical protein